MVSLVGYYMYIEASRKRKDDNAKLEILPGLAAGKTCISFFYHMRGGQMGTLRVLVDGKQVFERSGHQGFDWRTAQFTVERRASSVNIFAFIIQPKNYCSLQRLWCEGLKLFISVCK